MWREGGEGGEGGEGRRWRRNAHLVHSQEHVHDVLLLQVGEGVAVEAFDALQEVPRGIAVRRADRLRAAIL